MLNILFFFVINFTHWCYAADVKKHSEYHIKSITIINECSKFLTARFITTPSLSCRHRPQESEQFALKPYSTKTDTYFYELIYCKENIKFAPYSLIVLVVYNGNTIEKRLNETKENSDDSLPLIALKLHDDNTSVSIEQIYGSTEDKMRLNFPLYV